MSSGNLFEKDTRNLKKFMDSKKYCVVYVKSNQMKYISKKVFKQITNYSSIVNNEDLIIKVIGKMDKRKVQHWLNQYTCESNVIGNIQSFLSGLSVLVSLLMTVGKIKDTVKAIPLSLVSSVIKLIMNVYDVVKGDCDIHKLTNILLDMFSVYSRTTEWKAQGLESVVLAGLSYLLPTPFTDFIKRMSLFSQAKVCDDSSLYYSAISSLEEICKWILSKFPGGKSIMSCVMKVLEFFKISTSHMLIKHMFSLLEQHNKNQKLLLNLNIRKEIAQLNEAIMDDKSIIEWSRRSTVISNGLKSFSRLVKISSSYDTQGREEPNCFIFEGPPGTRKSVVVNKIIELMQEPCYCHIVKTTKDGKDWYDNYQNESIFYMDDVGQQGVSQWRTIINMVSAVKMPLDCADANLKDTKFFNSNKLFITTNAFSKIQGICRDDCISDVKALWRRGFVFNFDQVEPLGDELTGRIQFKFFDVMKDSWQMSFPEYLVKEVPSLRDISTSFELTGVNSNEMLLWMFRIIKSFEFGKKKIFTRSGVSESLKETANESLLSFLPESLHNVLSYFGKAAGAVLTLDCIFTILGDSCFLETLEDFIAAIFSDVIEVIREGDWDVISNLVCSIVGVLGILLAFKKLFYSIVCPVIDDKYPNVVTHLFGYETKDRRIVPWVAEMSKFDESNVHNSVSSVASQMFFIELEFDNNPQSACFVSGRSVLIPAHLLKDKFVVGSQLRIIVYSNLELNKRMIEHEITEVRYLNREEDLAVLQLRPSFCTPFKDMSKWFLREKSSSINSVLGTSYLVSINKMCAPLGKINGSTFSRYVKYALGDWEGCLQPKDISYSLHGTGMCGSLVFSPLVGVMGMHVAGNEHLKQGVAKMWSGDTLKQIGNILRDPTYFIPCELKETKESETSVVRLEMSLGSSACNKTNFGKSPLYGIFPVTREPANLTKFGRCTVKDVAKKSFKPTKEVNEDDLAFGRKVFESMLVPYGDISEEEVVVGNGFLNGLNKDSSNGLGCSKEKDSYIDFEKKEYTPLLREQLKEIREDVKNKKFPWKYFVWSESLKDELRGVEKGGLPRSFRVATIHNQVLSKEKFGKLVEHIIKTRWFNQIMVGVNPYKDWDRIYFKIAKALGVFAGDVKQWDGGMLPQVQRMVTEVLLSFYEGPEKELCALLLEGLVHSLLVVLDDVFLTTHSMPSGHFLTAIMNSFVNKIYTAMWYRHCMEKAHRPYSVSSFWADLDDFVYGDDKLNAIYNHADILNALSLKEYFESLGLGLTTSTKQEIVKPFDELSEIEFLKRKFVFHYSIGRVMCPLDLRTIYSSLSYVDYTKDVDLVMQDKINAAQRELFLHSEELLEDFVRVLNEHKVVFRVLPLNYLRYLFLSDEEMNDLNKKYL